MDEFELTNYLFKFSFLFFFNQKVNKSEDKCYVMLKSRNFYINSWYHSKRMNKQILVSLICRGDKFYVEYVRTIMKGNIIGIKTNQNVVIGKWFGNVEKYCHF